jgi:hypothetical protein
VLFDGSNYHLVLTGDGTGTANAFTVSGTGGLAGLSYHAGASGLSLSQSATNAGFSWNNISITSGSNTISGVIPRPHPDAGRQRLGDGDGQPKHRCPRQRRAERRSGAQHDTHHDQPGNRASPRRAAAVRSSAMSGSRSCGRAS